MSRKIGLFFISLLLVCSVVYSSVPVYATNDLNCTNDAYEILIARGYPRDLLNVMPMELQSDICITDDGGFLGYQNTVSAVSDKTVIGSSSINLFGIPSSTLSVTMLFVDNSLYPTGPFTELSVWVYYDWLVLPLNRLADPIAVTYDNLLFSYKPSSFTQKDYVNYDRYLMDASGSIIAVQREVKTFYSDRANDVTMGVSWGAELQRPAYILGSTTIEKRVWGYANFKLMKITSNPFHGTTYFPYIYVHSVNASASVGFTYTHPIYGVGMYASFSASPNNASYFQSERFQWNKP